MASTLVKLKGKANWSKIFPHFKDKNEDFHGPGGAYTIDLVVEQEELEKYTSTGGRIRPRVTDEGVVIKFKRKHQHPIEDFSGPPQVVDKNSDPWDGTMLGNGTEVEVAVSVYDSKMGKGTRLEGVRVLDLVEMPPMEDAEGGGSKRLPF